MFKRRDHHGQSRGDLKDMILLSLYNRGPMTLEELEDAILTLQSHFELPAQEFARGIIEKLKSSLSRIGFPGGRIPSPEMTQELPDIRGECDVLISTALIVEADGRFVLNEEGEIRAKQFTEDLQKAARAINRHFLNPQAAARNTVIMDLVLALTKLVAGLLSRSMGLVADGADAAIDTASASVVWAGVKYRRELLGTVAIVVMMFFTGLMVGYESISKIAEALTSTVEAITRPYLVILVEAFALLVAAALTFYQRFVGKRSGSLALISQSIDSKNHIYVAGVVILGAVLSIFGIHFVDPFIGAFIAVKIMMDGTSLAREAVSCYRSGQADLSKYGLPLEREWQLSKQATFRNWVLHILREKGSATRGDIVTALQQTFNPPYAPVITEFDYKLGKDMDFEREFDSLLQPLLDGDLVRVEGGSHLLTREGRSQVDRVFRVARYRGSRPAR